MSSRSAELEDGVKALRDLTAQPRDGQATRARVLVAASANLHRRRRLRRFLPILGVVGVALGSGAGAFTAGHRFWRAAEPAGTRGEAPAVRASDGTARAPLDLPSAPAVEPQESRAPDEYDLYSRAHEAHFRGKDARNALAAWDEYLRQAPRGAFAPEARFNRAICLLRLGRTGPAAAALRRFAEGKLGRYRRAEACALLRRLAEPLPDGCPRAPAPN
jgi:hypothetical protein